MDDVSRRDGSRDAVRDDHEAPLGIDAVGASDEVTAVGKRDIDVRPHGAAQRDDVGGDPGGPGVSPAASSAVSCASSSVRNAARRRSSSTSRPEAANEVAVSTGRSARLMRVFTPTPITTASG